MLIKVLCYIAGKTCQWMLCTGCFTSVYLILYQINSVVALSLHNGTVMDDNAYDVI